MSHSIILSGSNGSTAATGTLVGPNGQPIASKPVAKTGEFVSGTAFDGQPHEFVSVDGTVCLDIIADGEFFTLQETQRTDKGSAVVTVLMVHREATVREAASHYMNKVNMWLTSSRMAAAIAQGRQYAPMAQQRSRYWQDNSYQGVKFDGKRKK